MLQFRRLRLEDIGHRAAGFKSLVLDLTGGTSSIDGLPMQPVDVILWLRNGGGKSSLLSLLSKAACGRGQGGGRTATGG
jgi:hypothetical protein